ncbi:MULTISPECIES: hypothetical protein [unclassified Bradyrhizobium]|uniref:hypothetical protein n=1 Tax=unclassified Bradyrhizobium TaxID=2631580 RepID=UPI001BA54E73|nr:MULTISPECIES: hypothetical protein [unclassified Bradyrhizobium]MBR1206082.1 hypothetical protein [Bradyrhizobium sp. AUGA SZCCT0124]MBR1314792.1 hypothetical protein [Bradyrhizobium sp. AUGA SZCCT0051]MBR1341763.1 hypothetical protein [Bradyrhizobium sp. AUGA SZCCT0105]MBR1358836.1 hypothetical protein [Bradyrhizobium sp. AUGA SZCCT0045]
MPSIIKTPIRLYLDSSDISNLAKRDDTFADTRNALLALIEQGVLETRFSFFHVIELAHTVMAAKPDALDRAKLLQKLCKARALLYPDKLYLCEARSLIEDGYPEHQKGSQARVYVEDATWLPDWITAMAPRLAVALTRRLESEIAGFTRKIIDEMRLGPMARTRTGLNFLPDGKPNAKILAIAKDQIDSLLLKWRAKLPFRPQFWSEKLLIRYLQGEVGERKLHEECLAAFSDPRTFIEWCVDEIPEVHDLPGDVRQSGQENAKLITELRERMTEDQAFIREIVRLDEPQLSESDLTKKIRSFRDEQMRVIPPDLGKYRDDELRNLFQANVEKLERLGIDQSRWDSCVPSSSIGSLPAFDVLLEAANSRFVDDAKSTRQMSHSDAGDLLHSLYVPYVDIFRADRSFRARIGGIAQRFQTVLAPDLRGLPELVKQMADARH